MRRFFRKVIVAALSFGMMVSGIPSLPAEAAGISKPTGFVSAVEKYGAVKIAKDPSTGYQQLCAEDGTPVQLKGMSSFGIQWGEGKWILNDAVFDTLAYDWNCDVIRLAMYVTEGGYASNPSDALEKIDQGIKLATERGMYVLVDWHILNPGDPTSDSYLDAGQNLSQYDEIRAAHPEYTGPQLFFAYMSKTYGDQGNVLFEIANEPNGNGSEGDSENVWKNKLLPYHQSVVNAIRAYDKDSNPNVVICGTDNWSQFVDAPAANPVVDPAVTSGQAAVNQVMYTVHFYSASHDIQGNNWLKSKIQSALNGGIAVFCTEWGTSEASGDGGPNLDNATVWLNFLAEKKISWCSWSLALKDETSSSTKPTVAQQPTDLDGDGIPNWNYSSEGYNSDLSQTGIYVRSKIKEGHTWGSDNPDGPDNPDNPDGPDNPDNPDNPDGPDNPDNPDGPDNPDNPDNPDGPTNPTNPDNPPAPVAPTKPNPAKGKTNGDGQVQKGETVVTAIGTYTAVSKTEASYKPSAAAKKKVSISIPATVKIDGKNVKVTKIADKAFANNKKLKKLTIGANIKTIGKKAFYKCTNLQTVKFGKALKSIGAYAFYGCKKLKAAGLGAKVTTIGAYAFYGCASMKSAILGAAVKSVGQSAFAGCKSLKLIKVKGKVIKTVGAKAFSKIFAKANFRMGKKNFGNKKLRNRYKKLFKKSGAPKKSKVVK